MRVVSLTCSNTEIVCALGCADALVGIDDHSDYPVEVVSRLPRVGPDLGIDVERVGALDPDLVLASLTVPGHEKVVAKIEGAGLPFIAPAPERLGDVYRDIADIAERLGVPERGRRLIQEMRAVIGASSADDDDPGDDDSGDDDRAGNPRPRILVEWWPKPVIVPGRRSWVTDLLRAAGGVNPFGQRDVLSTPVTDAEVVTGRPDAVVISWCGVEVEKYRPEKVYARENWAHTPALAHRRVHSVAEAFLGRPGPRLVEGYRALRQIVLEVAAEPGLR